MISNFSVRIYSLALTSAFLLSLVFAANQGKASESKFGIGFKVGGNYLDGDWSSPRLTPMTGLALSYSPSPFFKVIGDLNYTHLKTRDNPNRLSLPAGNIKSFSNVLLPLGIGFQIDLAPLSTVSPFVAAQAGWLWWKPKYERSLPSQIGNKYHLDSFVKTGGGVEFHLSKVTSFNVGVDYQFAFTDQLDLRDSGDENDAISTIWAGMTYYLKSANKDDFDKDGIPNELDLSPRIPEDFNMFMDHDGRPEGGVKPFQKDPVVLLHKPIFKAYADHDIRIDAQIHSQNSLRMAAVLYRGIDEKQWRVSKLLSQDGTNYTAKIPEQSVKKNGIEYCIVAVDSKAKNIGYSGLPQRPIRVKVIEKASTWRIFGSAVAAISWGTAVYFGLRKQKN
jgi:hypothetical protein